MRVGMLPRPLSEALLIEDRELIHREVPIVRGLAPRRRDVAQREPDEFCGGFVTRKCPRVLMILRRRACTLSRALVV